MALVALIALVAAGFALDWRARGIEREITREYAAEGLILNIDGSRVHAMVSGEGPDLVLLHGASGSLREWTFQLASELSSRYRVFAFDRPGLGYSDPIHNHGASPADQARVLAKAAEMLGADKPIVVGHSFGGAVASAWALDHPASALVVLAGATYPWETGVDWTYHAASRPVLGQIFNTIVLNFVPASYISGVVERVFRPEAVPDGYREHIGPEQVTRRWSAMANARQVMALKGNLAIQAPRYPELTLPVEILHGDADTTVGLPIHSERMAADVGSARLTVLPGVGHMLHQTQPEAVIDVIDRAALRAGQAKVK